MNRLYPAVSNLGRFRKAGTDKPQVAGPSGRIEIDGEMVDLSEEIVLDPSGHGSENRGSLQNPKNRQKDPFFDLFVKN